MLPKCEVCGKEEAIALILDSPDEYQYYIGAKCLEKGNIFPFGNDCVLLTKLGTIRVTVVKSESIFTKGEVSLKVRNWEHVHKPDLSLFDPFDDNETFTVICKQIGRAIKARIAQYRPVFTAHDYVTEEAIIVEWTKGL